MPFKNLSELEFNFIWVGGNPMPDDQLMNLFNFVGEHIASQAKIRVWVDNEATYKIVANQLKSIIDAINADYKEKASKGLIRGFIPLTFKNQLKNLSFAVISHTNLEIPEDLHETIEKTRAAKLWGGLSDIYRLLILSRKYKAGEPHVRFYVEADNRMVPDLWNNFKSQSVGAVYLSAGIPSHFVFGPAMFRTDLLLLDISTDQGLAFAASIRPNFVKIFCKEPLLKLCFDALQRDAIAKKGLAEEDVLCSYGMLITTLFRMHFMTEDAKTDYGYRDILVDHATLKNSHLPISGKQALSWLDKSKDYEFLYSGCLKRTIALLMNELNDLSGLVVQYALRYYVGVESKKDFEEQIESIMVARCKINDEPLPEWFSEIQKSFRERPPRKFGYKAS